MSLINGNHKSIKIMYTSFYPKPNDNVWLLSIHPLNSSHVIIYKILLNFLSFFGFVLSTINFRNLEEYIKASSWIVFPRPNVDVGQAHFLRFQAAESKFHRLSPFWNGLGRGCQVFDHVSSTENGPQKTYGLIRIWRLPSWCWKRLEIGLMGWHLCKWGRNGGAPVRDTCRAAPPSVQIQQPRISLVWLYPQISNQVNKQKHRRVTFIRISV